MDHEVPVTLGLRRKSLHATVILACRKCGAPGVYRGHESIKNGWPGCYDPKRDGEPVGPTCPNCSARRPGEREMGEVTASMPLWVWRGALGLKWCLIRMKLLKRRLRWN